LRDALFRSPERLNKAGHDGGSRQNAHNPEGAPPIPLFTNFGTMSAVMACSSGRTKSAS
jgi:hypothetical protein